MRTIVNVAVLAWVAGYATGSPAFVGDTFKAGTVPSAAIARFMAAEDVTAHAHYAFLDDSTVRNPAPGLLGHASFDASATISGAEDIDHHHAYQDASVWSGTGTLRRMAALQVNQVITAGHVREAAGLYFSDPTHTGGSIDELAAVRVFELTAGKQNYSFKSSGRAKMLQNGELQVGGGVVVGAPRGGNTGADTINVAGDVYRNGAALGAQIDALTKRVAELEAALRAKQP